MTASRKALILAGGGMKVAAQAGVLQVWLDEAALRFDHADGCSGGVLNLAMYCQGMTGTAIAENWRSYRPLRNLQFNCNQLLTGRWGESLLRLDRMREGQLHRWGMDWTRIRSSKKSATFNVYNFTQHKLLTLEPARMTPKLLMACIALPTWFPPVRQGRDLLVDAVYATDANLMDAIHHGVDELWIIWTVSTKGHWHNGVVPHYFQIIEAAANSDLRASLAAIQENNEAVAAGRPSQFGRRIGIRMLEFEVPMHYLLEFRRRSFPQAVDLGIDKARQWCVDEGIPLKTETSKGSPVAAHSGRRDLTFSERMKGFIYFSQTVSAGEGRLPLRHKLTLDLRINIHDLDMFLSDPQHIAALTGTITCQALGGKLSVRSGTIELLPEGHLPPHRTCMRYKVYFEDSASHPLVLNGVKDIVHDRAFDLWADTTTLDLGISSPVGAGGNIAEGAVQISPVELVKMGLSFRSNGSIRQVGPALFRFFRFFLKRLSQIYSSQKTLQ